LRGFFGIVDGPNRAEIGCADAVPHAQQRRRKEEVMLTRLWVGGLCLFAVLLPPVYGQEIDDEEGLPRVFRYTDKRPGSFFPVPPMRTDDPVPPLTEEEASRYAKGVSDLQCKELMEAYVDRVETAYFNIAPPPDGLAQWLSERPQIRRTLLLALSPYFDDIKAALALFDSFRREEPEATERFFQLAVALAVVWDTPDALLGSRYNCIWGLVSDQFRPLLTPLEILRYFTDPKRQKTFLFPIDELVWPVMVYLVNFDVTMEEAEWAVAKYGKQKKNIGGTYSQVPYDYDKLSRTPKLGTRPYILPNLLKYGGVCGDQAHFCSRVAKSLGIPAMKAGGLGRYGGAGHAFTCYFVVKRKRPLLASTGRYFNDFYYVGTIFDPQTRTRIYDRTVAMVLDGASLSYPKYEVSRTLTRIALAFKTSSPKLSLVFAKKALTQNWFYGPAWKLLMRHIRDGSMGKKEAIAWANNMMKFVKDHPDLTQSCFSTFVDCIPIEETKRRQLFYKQAMKLYDERPDLQLDLRFRQASELRDAGKELDALVLFLQTAGEHSKEGRLILPLVKEGVALVKKKEVERKVIGLLDNIPKRFPKRRQGKIAKAFQDLVGMLAPLYETAGKQKEADKLRRQAGM
jgi:hypothetical protein